MSESNFLYTVSIVGAPGVGAAVRTIQIAGGDSLDELLTQAAAVGKALKDKGWQFSTLAPAPAAPSGADNAAPPSSGGLAANEVMCTKITVAESFKDPKKPQLHFDIGDKTPVKTNAKPGEWGSLAERVKGLITLDKRPILAADMVKGRVFTGAWILTYSVSGEYKNLEAIRNV